MKPLDYVAMMSTRDYLQDVAKVIGKAQQVFLPQNPHEWQKGLEITAEGLVSQTFQTNAGDTRIILDMRKGEVRIDDKTWPLVVPASELLLQLEEWAGKEIAQPDFMTHEPTFKANEAHVLADVLGWVREQLQKLKNGTNTGSTSPILLFPHHFDASLVWFPDDTEKQLSFGFSTGDETITEPYFYSTAYPEPPEFTNIELPEHAFWQHQDFSGAVITYNVLAEKPDAEEVLQTYFASLLQAF